MVFHKESQLPKLISPMVYNLEGDVSNQPYYPFLQIVRDAFRTLSDRDLKRLIKKTVYPLHREIFYNYIRDILYRRDEEIILEELEYEQHSFIDDIYTLLNSLKNTLDIVIYNAQNTSEYNRTLMDKLDKKSKSINIYSTHISKMLEDSTIEINISRIRDYYNFLEIEECKKLLDSVEVESLNNDELYEFYKINGDIYLYQKDYDKALITFNQLLSITHTNRDNCYVLESYRKLAICHLHKNNPEDAKKYGEHFHKLAQAQNSVTLMAHSAYINFRLQIFMSAYSEYFNNLHRDFSILESAGFYNYLSLIFTNGNLLISLLKSSEETENVIGYFEWGFDIAKRHKNRYRMATAYATKGIIEQANGLTSQAEESYLKALKIKKQLMCKKEIAQTANSLGYFYFTQGDYELARKYLNLALRSIKNSRNYEEICSTFFNFGSMNFYTGNYNEAVKSFNTILNIMDPLGITDLSYHSRITIYSLLGSSLLYLDRYDEAILLYKKLKVLPLYKEEDHDYEFLSLFNGCIKRYEGDKESAIIFFQEASKIQYDKKVKERYFQDRIRFELGERELVEHKPIKPGNFNYQSIIELVKLDNSLNNLHQRVEEISFLNNLQDLLRDVTAIEELLNMTSKLIVESFLIDTIIIKQESIVRVNYSSHGPISEESINIQKKMLSKISVDRYTLYFGNLFSSTKVSLTTEKILNISFKQIITSIEKLEQDIIIRQKNEELEFKVKQRTKELELSLDKINRQTKEIELYNQQLEDLVEERSKKLVESEKLASLGSLVAGLAHEINTPLGVLITSNSQLVDENKRVKRLIEESRLKKSDLFHMVNTTSDLTDIITAGSRRVNELISSFKRLSIDRNLLDKIDFNVKSYIDEILLLFGTSVDLKNIQISIQCSPDLVIHSYPGLFSQIVTNLIQNSVIHGFTKEIKGHIWIDIDVKDNQFIMTFTDNGVGIDRDILPQIFDPFFTTRRTTGGTGLGLHIIYNIIHQNLSGNISCEITERGTEFHISFPL